MWLSDAENRLSIGSLVQKIYDAEKRHGRSVGRSVGRVAQLEKILIFSKTRSAFGLARNHLIT